LHGIVPKGAPVIGKKHPKKKKTSLREQERFPMSKGGVAGNYLGPSSTAGGIEKEA